MQKYAIGKRATENGTPSTLLKHFRKETTVRRFKTKYQSSLKTAGDGSPSDTKELLNKKHRKPLLIGEELD